MHVHISLLEFLQTAAFIIVFGFFWRTLAARYSDTSVGKAMAFIF